MSTEPSKPGYSRHGGALRGTLLAGVGLALALVLLSAYIGRRGSPLPMLLLVGGFGGLLVLARPVLGLPLIIVGALLARYTIPTGTEVTLNLAVLLVPAVVVAWVVGMLARGQIRLAKSPVNKPLLLFLLAGVLSLAIGNALWDPAVPRSERFALVQWAQWGIFALSALAFWLGANLLRDRRWLERVTWTFLWLGGGLAIARLIPPLGAVSGARCHLRAQPSALLDPAGRPGRRAVALQQGFGRPAPGLSVALPRWPRSGLRSLSSARPPPTGSASRPPWPCCCGCAFRASAGQPPCSWRGS